MVCIQIRIQSIYMCVKPIFLANTEDSDKLIQNLKVAIHSQESFLHLDNIDFNIEFQHEINTAALNVADMLVLKESCFQYLKKLLKEMLDRLPENMHIFQIYSHFSISKCCNSIY